MQACRHVYSAHILARYESGSELPTEDSRTAGASSNLLHLLFEHFRWHFNGLSLLLPSDVEDWAAKRRSAELIVWPPRWHITSGQQFCKQNDGVQQCFAECRKFNFPVDACLKF